MHFYSVNNGRGKIISSQANRKWERTNICSCQIQSELLITCYRPRYANNIVRSSKVLITYQEIVCKHQYIITHQPLQGVVMDRHYLSSFLHFQKNKILTLLNTLLRKVHLKPKTWLYFVAESSFTKLLKLSEFPSLFVKQTDIYFIGLQ